MIKLTTYLQRTMALLFALTICLGNVHAQESSSITLFHESFGDNSSTARNWDDSYSVKTGVSDVYKNVSYTITNAKQSKNTVGSTDSGLSQSSKSSDAEFIVGPLDVSNYSSLVLTYQWKAASIKETTSVHLNPLTFA